MVIKSREDIRNTLLDLGVRTAGNKEHLLSDISLKLPFLASTSYLIHETSIEIDSSLKLF